MIRIGSIRCRQSQGFGEIGAAGDTKFAIGAGQMILHRANRDLEFNGDCAIGMTGCREQRYLLLAVSEHLVALESCNPRDGCVLTARMQRSGPHNGGSRGSPVALAPEGARRGVARLGSVKNRTEVFEAGTDLDE